MRGEDFFVIEVKWLINEFKGCLWVVWMLIWILFIENGFCENLIVCVKWDIIFVSYDNIWFVIRDLWYWVRER